MLGPHDRNYDINRHGSKDFLRVGKEYPADQRFLASQQKTSTGFMTKCATLRAEATPSSHREEFETMAARRYQQPTPERSGGFWYIRVRQDVFEDGVLTRKLKRIKIAGSETPARQVQRMAAELLRPMNQGLVTAGSAVSFSKFVNDIYIPTRFSLLRKPTRDRYQPIIEHYLFPAFGTMMLSQLTFTILQRFCASLDLTLSFESRDKIRDVLGSILKTAVRAGFLVTDPTVGLQVVHDKKPRHKPIITPEQFDALVNAIPEPYATVVYVAGWTGLRVSELLGLKWRCIHSDSITIEQRYCRGDWDVPKTAASAATIGVEPEVIQRIQRLTTLTVNVRAGLGMRRYRVVRASGPDDLVFQNLLNGKPMSDRNILSRIIKPAAKRLGIEAVNWQILRRSHATWLVQAGSDPKSVQGQLRHARISTTMDIYAQIVPQQQRIALGKLTEFVTNRVTLLSHKIEPEHDPDRTESPTIQ
jgi:integrase